MNNGEHCERSKRPEANPICCTGWFQNLRSTRETELAERCPEHVICAWIGNSRVVARKHYLQVTEEHFEQAAMAGAQAAQNPAQQPAVLPRKAVPKEV